MNTALRLLRRPPGTVSGVTLGLQRTSRCSGLRPSLDDVPGARFLSDALVMADPERDELKVNFKQNFVLSVEQPVEDMDGALKPREVVDRLDQHIVGQADAKRAVAIALRNRWRRKRLSKDMQASVIPKNILMIGPTGCGKTEIARQIAKLSQAPFIKVEATKFTEVGFHGKDVDSIIKDLVEVSINMMKRLEMERMRELISRTVEEKILDQLTGDATVPANRATFRELLRQGAFDSKVIKVKPNSSGQQIPLGSMGVISGEMINTTFIDMLNGKKMQVKPPEAQDMKVKEARKVMEEAELDKKIDMAKITRKALLAVEESGIVFIDELDKICHSGERYKGADASAEGVQRDLLPLIEGTSVQTKHGNVNTDFVLFIGSGAFHSSKPSDLLSELQGRLPIRVTVKPLTVEDMYLILTQPVNNIIKQQIQLLAAEQVDLRFTEEAIQEVARVSALVNKTVQNIGARRLQAVIERIVESISFDASDKEPGEVVIVDKTLVQERLSDMLIKSDMSKYII